MKTLISDYLRYIAEDELQEISYNDLPDKIKKTIKIEESDIDNIKKDEGKYTTVHTIRLKKGHKIVNLKTQPPMTVGGDNLIIAI